MKNSKTNNSKILMLGLAAIMLLSLMFTSCTSGSESDILSEEKAASIDRLTTWQ